MFDLLVGLRTLELARGRSGLGLGDAAYMRATDEMGRWTADEDEDYPFFNPFFPKGEGYRGPKFPSNGPASNIWKWQTTATPFQVHEDGAVKQISRRPESELDASALQAYFVGKNPTKRPSLLDVAVWYLRNEEFPDDALPSVDDLCGRFVTAIGFADADTRLLFKGKELFEPTEPEFAASPPEPSDFLPPRPTGTVKTDSKSSTSAKRTDDVGKVVDYIEGKGYTFEPWQVAAYITAVQTKPFVILAGISGTGKTRLPRLVAEATGAEPVVVVPVRPDWTDSSDLLGYTALDQTFVPGRLLQVCREAIENADQQYFFVLDEMNVARVEYYFAEVLSLMENRRLHAGKIVTDPMNPLAVGGDPTLPWNQVYLPSNVAIVGTVNMDETTHGFSRKVLDRAFVIELTDVDLTDYGTAAGTPTPPLKWSAADWKVSALRLAESPDLGDPSVKQTVDALVNANSALRLAQLQVGYRVRDEAALFCLAARTHVDSFVDMEDAPVSPLDLCIGMKVLPRIQGGGALIGNVLSELDRWMGPATAEPVIEGDDDEAELETGAVTFPRSHERVQLMKDRLSQTGFTSYWV